VGQIRSVRTDITRRDLYLGSPLTQFSGLLPQQHTCLIEIDFGSLPSLKKLMCESSLQIRAAAAADREL
jgi:hypothetical protein